MFSLAVILIWVSATLGIVTLPVLIWVFCKRGGIAKQPVLQAVLGPVTFLLTFLGILGVWLCALAFPPILEGMSACVFWAISGVLALTAPLVVFWTTLGAEGLRRLRTLLLSGLTTIGVLAGLAAVYTVVQAIRRALE